MIFRLKPAVLCLSAGVAMGTAAPALAATVTIPAFTASSFTDEDGDGFFESGASGPLASVSVRNFSFPGTPTEITLLGFDTSGLLGSEVQIDSIDFVFNVSSYTTSTTGVNIGSFGYLGGLPTVPNVPTSTAGSFVPDDLGTMSVPLTGNVFITAETNNLLGLRLSGGETANVQLDGPGAFNEDNRPQLVINYTPVPEPTAVTAMLATGGLLVLRRRR